MQLASRPRYTRRVVRCHSYAGQSSRRCFTVSGASRHAGHSGDSTHFMLWRCRFSGACPVRSWTSIDWFLHERWLVARKYAVGEKFGSVRLNFSYLGEFASSGLAFALTFAPMRCLVADQLTGRVYLRISGMSCVIEDRPPAASFAY